MVEESLKCPVCRQMFRQAIVTPCCGATFCSDCIMDRLAHSSADDSRCPGCNGEVLAHQLVPNEDIRTQVEQITRATKANAIASTSQPAEKPDSLLSSTLKDRVTRPKKRSADEGAASGMLAIADASTSSGPSTRAAGAAQSSGPFWQPLGFGPMLSPAQFAVWKQ